jgi:hypothetical protein
MHGCHKHYCTKVVYSGAESEGTRYVIWPAPPSSFATDYPRVSQFSD